MSSVSLSDFNVLKTLGNGAFSWVYKVQRKQDGQVYALKKVKLRELSYKEKENALNEIRILASINSPHIIRYKDAFYDNASGCLCIVMEFAENGDLMAKLQDYKKRNMFMDEAKIWKYAAQILLGLKSLHNLKILHRDLKCANIFLGANNKVKLGDLNVSKIMKRDLAYTQTGTPYYTSPEVWQNQPYDSKCDVWSMGCVLYELMAHHPPFEAKSMEELYKKVCKGTYQKLPKSYSQEMNDFINLCLRKNPKQRPCVNSLLEFQGLQPYLQNILENEEDKENKQPNIQKNNSLNLLQTMKMPYGNLNALKNILPKAQFEDSIDSFMEEQSLAKKSSGNRPISAVNNNDLKSNFNQRHSLEPQQGKQQNQQPSSNNQRQAQSPPSHSNQQILSSRQRIQSAHNAILCRQDSNSSVQNQLKSNNNNNALNGINNCPLPKSPEILGSKKISALQRNGIEMVRPRNSIEEGIPLRNDRERGSVNIPVNNNRYPSAGRRNILC
ncbi:hypothetical protein ABPG74_016916 [Tetrahymena malaccensis]